MDEVIALAAGFAMFSIVWAVEFSWNFAVAPYRLEIEKLEDEARLRRVEQDHRPRLRVELSEDRTEVEKRLNRMLFAVKNEGDLAAENVQVKLIHCEGGQLEGLDHLPVRLTVPRRDPDEEVEINAEDEVEFALFSVHRVDRDGSSVLVTEFEVGVGRWCATILEPGKECKFTLKATARNALSEEVRGRLVRENAGDDITLRPD